MDTKKLLRYSFWMGPILLGISIIGWEKPLELPLQMPLFFSIIGVIAGLWMAFTFLIRPQECSIWTTLSIGLPSICLSAICAIGYEAFRKQIIYSTAILQVIYIIAAILRYITSKTVSRTKTLKKQINQQLKKIFPTWLLWSKNTSLILLGFFIVCFFTFFLWVFVIVTIDNYTDFEIYIIAGLAVSGLPILLTLPFLLITDTVIPEFKKSLTPARGVLFSSTFMLAFFGSLVAWFIFLIKWKFAIIYLSALALVCYKWYRLMLKVLQKAKESDYLQCINKIAAEEDEATIKILDPRMIFFNASVTDEGIVFQNIQEEKLCPWAEIKYIHLKGDKGLWLQVTDEQGNSSGGRSYQGKINKQVEKIWTLWSENIAPENKNYEFEYPDWKIAAEKQGALLEGILLLAGGLIGPPLIITAMISDSEAFPLTFSSYALFSFIGIFGLGMAISGIGSLLSRKQKKFVHLAINESKCIITYDDDSRETKQINRIKRYDLGIHTSGAWIRFDDKTKLKNLDKLSYWPLLRNYLLQELNIENPVKLF